MAIAIDVGTRALHLVQGNARKNQVTINQALIDPLPAGMVQDGIIREFGGMEMGLRNFLHKYRIRDKDCYVTINGNHIYYRELIVPRSKPKVMQNVVTFEIQSSMNNSKEVAVEFVITDKPVPDQPEMVMVKASAIQLQYVDDYHKLLKNVKLNPVALDVHSNAVAKLFAGREVNGQSLSGRPASFLLLDIGAVTTTAYVYSNGEILYSRIIPNGSVEIERFVTQIVDSHPEREQVPIEQLDLRLANLRQDTLLADAVRPMVTAVTGGVQRILQYMAGRLQDNRVEKAFLFGRTALYNGLDNTIADALSLPTETIRSLSQVTMPDNTPIAPYINAIGALIRKD